MERSKTLEIEKTNEFNFKINLKIISSHGTFQNFGNKKTNEFHFKINLKIISSHGTFQNFRNRRTSEFDT